MLIFRAWATCGGLNRVRVGRGLDRGSRTRGRKNEKSKDYCKADQNNVYCFFMIIFRLATPAFFKFTNVTEFVEGITILYRGERRNKNHEDATFYLRFISTIQVKSSTKPKGGGWGHSIKVLYGAGEAPLRGPTCYLFILTIFNRKGTPFTAQPFSHSSLDHCISFSCCKFFRLLNMIKSLNQRVFASFSQP